MYIIITFQYFRPKHMFWVLQCDVSFKHPNMFLIENYTNSSAKYALFSESNVSQII